MTMTQEKLNERLELHYKWAVGNDYGEKFEAMEENLSGADLRDADLRDADLRGANLHRANLGWADLRGANLHRANLGWADLREADLREVDLRDADLHGTKLDFSCLPLWCGSLYMHVDDRLAVQLLYHVVSTVLYSKHTSEELKRFCESEELLSWANRFHLADECGRLPRREADAAKPTHEE